MNNSPIVRFLKWCWTAEESLLFDVQLLEEVEKRFSKSGLTHDEVGRKVGFRIRMIERYERKRSANKPRRPRWEESAERPDQRVETRKTSQENRFGFGDEGQPSRDGELDRHIQTA